MEVSREDVAYAQNTAAPLITEVEISSLDPHEFRVLKDGYGLAVVSTRPQPRIEMSERANSHCLCLVENHLSRFPGHFGLDHSPRIVDEVFYKDGVERRRTVYIHKEAVPYGQCLTLPRLCIDDSVV
jgi:hypothetical protein